MDENQNFISLPNKVCEEALKEIIEKHLKNPAENFDITISAGSVKGDNYLGIVYRIEVHEKDKNQPKLSLILKTSPQNPVRRNEFIIHDFFNRESDFYDVVYPSYVKFQEEKGIDIKKDGFHEAPLCYKTLRNEPYEGQFFEDLKPLGYELYDRFDELKKENVFLVMKALAKMHALFYAIKDQKPELVQPFIEFQEYFLVLCERENSPMCAWYDRFKKQAMDVVAKIENADMRDRVGKVVNENLYTSLGYCFDRERMGEYATICHGDVGLFP